MYKSYELTIAQNQENLRKKINDLIPPRIVWACNEVLIYSRHHLINSLPGIVQLPPDILGNYLRFVNDDLEPILDKVYSKICNFKKQLIIQEVKRQTLTVANEIQHEIRLIEDRTIFYITITHIIEEMLFYVKRCFEQRLESDWWYGTTNSSPQRARTRSTGIVWNSRWEWESPQIVENLMRNLNFMNGRNIIYQLRCYYNNIPRPSNVYVVYSKDQQSTNNILKKMEIKYKKEWLLWKQKEDAKRTFSDKTPNDTNSKSQCDSCIKSTSVLEVQKKPDIDIRRGQVKKDSKTPKKRGSLLESVTKNYFKKTSMKTTRENNVSKDKKEKSKTPLENNYAVESIIDQDHHDCKIIQDRQIETNSTNTACQVWHKQENNREEYYGNEDEIYLCRKVVDETILNDKVVQHQHHHEHNHNFNFHYTRGQENNHEVSSAEVQSSANNDQNKSEQEPLELEYETYTYDKYGNYTNDAKGEQSDENTEIDDQSCENSVSAEAHNGSVNEEWSEYDQNYIEDNNGDDNNHYDANDTENAHKDDYENDDDNDYCDADIGDAHANEGDYGNNDDDSSNCDPGENDDYDSSSNDDEYSDNGDGDNDEN